MIVNQEQVHKLTASALKEVYVDRGYRILADGPKCGLREPKSGVTVAIKKKLKRRNAIEPVSGHMKNDGRLGRSFLKACRRCHECLIVRCRP